MLHGPTSQATNERTAGGGSAAGSLAAPEFALPAWGNQARLRAGAAAPQPRPSRTPLLQRECAACNDEREKKEQPGLQTKLAVNAPGDVYEQEADRVADQVMRMPAAAVQTQAVSSRLQRQSSAAPAPATAPPIVGEVLRQPGVPLDAETRAFMEPRFGADFSAVRVHTGAQAAASAAAVNATAYTVGENIAFGSDRYAPQQGAGRRLLAHELTHVLQQRGGRPTAGLQRGCDDPDYCEPYPTEQEAAVAKYLLKTQYLPADEALFGASSSGLFRRFLNRHSGDDLTPIVFDDPTSDVVDSFATASATADDQDEIIDLIGERLNWAGTLQNDVVSMRSIREFLSPTELENRPIDYDDAASISGHIAGGIGSSDAGKDTRKVIGGNVSLQNTPVVGSTRYVNVTVAPHYEVFDCIDFCPGNCGWWFETYITVPMSRLEASNEAYDQPFKVLFTPEPRSKRFWFF
jgi:hypothetical protein